MLTAACCTLALACDSGLTTRDATSVTDDPEPPLLAVPPLVGRPTANTVTLNVVTGELPVDFTVSLVPAAAPQPRATLAAGEVRELILDDLRTATEYRYELTVRSGDREETHLGRFVTRRDPGSSFTFALVSDTHLPVPPPEWQDPATIELFLPEILDYLHARLEIGQTILRAMDSIAAARPDFIVGMGDMVHYYRGFNDPFPSAAVAGDSYRDLRALLGRATAEAAFFAVIGNWEGENGWHSQRQQSFARSARMKYLPNPTASTYPAGGSPHGDYFAWTWGDAKLIVLNVMSYTPSVHTMSPEDDGTADDWTLGAEQLAWFERTLRRSQEPVKLVFAHHTVGGRAGDAVNSAYGRGGARAAAVGEQAQVHRLMVEHGVQAFFYGHDHVFTDAVVDGVHYTLPGSAGAPWKFGPEETGYDDYDERSGFALVHVGPQRIEVEFLDLDGTVFESFSMAVGER